MEGSTAESAAVDDRRLPASAEEAKKILQSIRIDRGFLGTEHEEELSRVRLETQEAVRRLAETARRKTVKYTNSIAGELYSSKCRFIYELLQNADDSTYAAGQGEPCITISLHPDRFVLDTNETGFTIANVKAICDTGESSKKISADDRSIGEKGYGFKSVFAVAYRARVQSGHWSFCFEHHEGDDGLGMLTPKDIEAELLPQGTTTRIELKLLDDPGDLFEQLWKELTSLHDTTIFFLQNIKRLVVNTHNHDGSYICTDIRARARQDQSAILGSVKSLTREATTYQNGQPNPTTSTTKFYHILDHYIYDMPPEKHRKDRTWSLLKLAFPFTHGSKEPIVDSDGEHVFAYLPLYRKPHLPFLIQGDFVTSNSRESVLDCAWNQHLRRGIAGAFRVAMERFCTDNIMRYQWLKYVPALLTSGFEHPLFSLIRDQIQHAVIFETWQSRSLSVPLKVKIVPAAYIHENEPILPDLNQEIYLAPEYGSSAYELLRIIGVQTMTQDDLVQRLVHDLDSFSSKLRATAAADPWHSTLSRAISTILDRPDNLSLRINLRLLKLIQLRKTTGQGLDLTQPVTDWVSAVNVEHHAVYFPENAITAGSGDVIDRTAISVPYGLAIRVVEPETVIQVQRRQLLAKLGVAECPPTTVVRAIHDCHEQWLKRPVGISTRTSVSHLQYLFWLRSSMSSITQPLLMPLESNRATSITLPHFLKSEARYDTWSMLKNLPLAERKGLAHFVNDIVMRAESDAVRRNGRSWTQWLEEIALAQRRPPLTSGGAGGFGNGLSSVMLHVLEHQNEQFLPLLQAHWSAEYHKYPVKAILGQSKVTCIDTATTPVLRTYLPTKILKDEADRVGLLRHIPFVKLPDLIESADDVKWSFLSDLGVASRLDLDFYLDLLLITQQLDELETFSVFATVTKLYASIGALCNRDKQSYVAKRLNECSGVYIPTFAKGQRWKQTSACLWNAPSCISVKFALADHYKSDNNISTLFCTFLGVKDVHLSDYLDELRYSKRTGLDGKNNKIAHSACAEIYRKLWDHKATPELLDHMRQMIEKEKLLFANGRWHSPSECLWSVDTSLSDQISIGAIYASLKGFFVTRLLVKSLTTAILVSDLMKRATAKTPLKCDDAKALIFKINTMLATDDLNSTLQAKFDELANTKCFPVKRGDGGVQLRDAGAKFAIVDHERFGRAFQERADLLDFSLDEVQRLRPFLEATNLRDNYLSDLVEEVSEVTGNSVESSELTIQLRSLAYALFCCAVRFKSRRIIGRDDSLYKSLLALQVHEAAEMGTSLVLKQNGVPIKVPSTKSQLKVDISSSPWRIFVPCDTKTRKACYTSQLPQAMLDLLGISGSPATLAIYRLINDLHKDGMEESILDEFDVLKLDWITRPTAPAQPRTIPSSSEPKDSSTAPNSPFRSLESQNTANTPSTGTGSKFSFGSSSSVRSSGSSGLGNTSDTPATPSPFGTSTTARTSSFGQSIGSASSTFFGGSPGFGSEGLFGCSKAFPTASHRRHASATSTPAFSFGTTVSGFGTPDKAREGFGGFGIPSRHSASAAPAPVFHFGAPPPSRNSGLSGLDPPLQQQKYRALLDNIIKRVSGDDHTWNLSDLASALPDTIRLPMLFDKDEIFGVRNEDHLAHDMKIGAAGELFAFEKLRAAGLPSFNENNWLSTIRHEIKVHEKYENMPDRSPDLPVGSKAEPADILYEDTAGKFLDFLEHEDSVGIEPWLRAFPMIKRKYYIEVKTTTRDCDTAFHMSKGQHTRMLKMRKTSGFQPGDVYVVCRVYNLLSNDINMRFYVSPGREDEARIQGSGISLPPTSFTGIGSAEPNAILSFTSKGFEVRPVK